MQIKRIHFNTGQGLFGSGARAMTAKLLDGIHPGLLAALMNYEAGTGKTLNGFPKVHFFGTRKGFGVTGFGDDGMAVVDDVLPLLHSRLSDSLKRIIPIDSRVMNATLEKRPYTFTYRVPQMVIQKHHHHTELLNDPARGCAHIERLFLSSIARQAQALGIEVPSGSEVSFLGAPKTFAAKSSKHGQAKLGLYHAAFEVNLRMTGIWTVGFMLSSGYGSIDANAQLGLARGVEVEVDT